MDLLNFNRQEWIDELPDGNLKECEQRLLDLDNKIDVGLDGFKLALKVTAMYEIYKDIYGDEIAPLDEILEKVNSLRG